MPVVDVALLPEHLTQHAIHSNTVIMVDVLRASTTIIAALEAGANSIHPVLEIQDAFDTSKLLTSALLCGERGGTPPEGFNLGNSPLEYTSIAVRDRQLILTTTNGTRALHMLDDSSDVYIGAITNRSAVCQAASNTANDITINCAGTDQVVSLDDTIAAGLMIQSLAATGYNTTETAQIIAASTQHHIEAAGSILSALNATAHGKRLIALGMDQDIQAASQIDTSSSVPKYNPKNRTITLP